MTNQERFKKNVRMVELEQHSYCNRKCWFCPNQVIDRQGPAKWLSYPIYHQILDDLCDIGYDQIISFSGNCEPFSQIVTFLPRVKLASQIVTDAFLMTNTNTDYLTTDIVRNVAHHGLDVIKAQLYFDKDQEFTEIAIGAKMQALKDKLPGIEFTKSPQGQWFALVGDMIIHAYAKNWHKVGHNRCDVQVRKSVRRMSTCGEPIQYIGVNYAGQVTPCCNIRGDYPPHAKAMLGQIDDTPGRIFDLYQGVLLPEDQYPCQNCMGKSWHANGKIVYEQILKELKDG